MTLTPDESAWVRNSLAEKADELRKAAIAARRRGEQHLPIRKASHVVAEAYDRAAIELERARKNINHEGGM